MIFPVCADCKKKGLRRFILTRSTQTVPFYDLRTLEKSRALNLVQSVRSLNVILGYKTNRCTSFWEGNSMTLTFVENITCANPDSIFWNNYLLIKFCRRRKWTTVGTVQPEFGMRRNRRWTNDCWALMWHLTLTADYC